ncbi:D-malate degradation protein R [Cedecea davisae]|uniref:LysR substrate binding domain protein n=1 Tax=Cedecea davisae DSM 4568 TaxID=566551 RepID=S3IXF0_9ENTR|nr:LysR substrate-binding domain-containing protein [Cedecea davisae]EPF17605.1 LysR substrate binding domain protein [Cedecea davisae DSM 4568]SUX27827.1 D-malate degradation protein R [Cedecea davisae]
MISSDDLYFFRTISAHATLAAAARAMNVTPPSVTQRLKGLEQKLGVSLILRPSRQVSLTDEGSLLLSRAEKILAELAGLQSAMDDRRQTVRGKLRVLAPLGFGNDYIAPLLGDYAAQHENLEVELTLSDDPHWATLHKWDLVIFIGELRDSSMHCIRLAANRRFICASPGYLSRRGTPAAPEQLANHDCIALRENSEDVTLWRFSGQEGDCPQRIAPRLSSNEGRVVKEWALAGRGIIMRSEWDVLPQINAGSLVRLLPEYQLPDADIVALTGSAPQERSPRTQKFIDLLREKLSSRPWERESRAG